MTPEQIRRRHCGFLWFAWGRLIDDTTICTPELAQRYRMRGVLRTYVWLLARAAG